MSESDEQVVIVGGGVIGLCSAIELAAAGRSVTVIDRDDMTAGASCGNAGLIALGHPPLPRPGLMRQSLKFLLDPTSPLYIPFRLDPALWHWLWAFRRACREDHFQRSMQVLAGLSHLSAERFRSLAADPDFDFEFHNDGLLDVCLSEHGLEHLLADARVIERHGFSHQALSGDELRDSDPTFLESVFAGVLYPGSASASPGQFMRALRTRATEQGVNLKPNSAVTKLHRKGRRVDELELSTGETIRAESIVLCGGVWTSDLAAEIGVKLPLQAAKGYHVNLLMPGQVPRRAGVLSETFIAATPMDGGLRLAGTLEFSGINHRFRRQRVEMLTRGARRYLHGIDEATITSAWCGLRPCTADGLPVISGLPGVENAYVASGHAMLGFGLGPATGVVVRRLIEAEDPGLDLAPLAASRF